MTSVYHIWMAGIDSLPSRRALSPQGFVLEAGVFMCVDSSLLLRPDSTFQQSLCSAMLILGCASNVRNDSDTYKNKT